MKALFDLDAADRRVRALAAAAALTSSGWLVFWALRLPAAARLERGDLVVYGIYGVLSAVVTLGLARRAFTPREKPWELAIALNGIWIILVLPGMHKLTPRLELAAGAATLALCLLGRRLERRDVVVSGAGAARRP